MNLSRMHSVVFVARPLEKHAWYLSSVLTLDFTEGWREGERERENDQTSFAAACVGICPSGGAGGTDETQRHSLIFPVMQWGTLH